MNKYLFIYVCVSLMCVCVSVMMHINTHICYLYVVLHSIFKALYSYSSGTVEDTYYTMYIFNIYIFRSADASQYFKEVTWTIQVQFLIYLIKSMSEYVMSFKTQYNTVYITKLYDMEWICIYLLNSSLGRRIILFERSSRMRTKRRRGIPGGPSPLLGEE